MTFLHFYIFIYIFIYTYISSKENIILKFNFRKREYLRVILKAKLYEL